MGIVNVTPDSFSDGGKYFQCKDAVERILQCAAQGADIIDIGGESTRPGATPISWQEELSRIEPVLKAVANENLTISVDTRHLETAARAIELGAKIINCVDPTAVPALLELITASKGEVELVVPYECRALCLKAGLLERVYIDPMIGFGTTREEDLKLLKRIPSLAKEGRLLIGASRKRIAQALSGNGDNTTLGTDVAISLWSAANGASAVRVHDVKLVAQALRTWKALECDLPQIKLG